MSVTARPGSRLDDRFWHATGNGFGLRATAASGVAVRHVASARRDRIVSDTVRPRDDRQTEHADDLADQCQAEGGVPGAACVTVIIRGRESPAFGCGRIVTGRMRSVDTHVS